MKVTRIMDGGNGIQLTHGALGHSKERAKRSSLASFTTIEDFSKFTINLSISTALVFPGLKMKEIIKTIIIFQLS